jgi:regulator of replication initiation timing
VSKPLERREITSPLPFNFLYQKGAKRMIEPLTDDELDMMRGLESPITLENKNQLIATIDALKESKQAILNMLGRMTADYDELEEENEKLKEENKKLKGEIEIRVLSQSENATRIIIKSFKEEIVELKDKIDNLKAEGYFE